MVRCTAAWVVLVLALGVLPTPRLHGEDEQEGSKRYDLYLPGTQPTAKGDMRGAILVRDERTGVPIQHARLRLSVEDLHNLTLQAPDLGVVFTDKYGIANSPGDTFDAQIVVDAPGYAPQGHYGGSFDQTFDLVRGVTAHGRLLDTAGKPYVDVPVEYYLGCHHSPAAQRVQTNAEGRFVFERAHHEGQAWLPYRMHTSNFGIGALSQRSDGVTRVLDRGWTASGRVVDGQGAPVAGCVVRPETRESSRGPAVATGRDGRFVLSGLAPDASLSCFHRDHDGGKTALHTTTAWHPSVPLLVRTGGLAAPEKTYPVLVATRPDLDVLAVRLSDGTGVRVEADGDGAAELELAAGRYRLFTGRPFEPYEAAPIEIDVPSPDGRTTQFKHTICPRLQTPFDRQHRERFGEGTLWCDGYARTVDMAEPGDVHIPSSRPVSLQLSDGLRTRVFPLAPVVASQRAVVIDWPKPTTIHVPFDVSWVVAPGEYVVTHDTGDPRTLTTYATGSVTLRMMVAGEDDDVRAEVVLPNPSGGEVHVTEKDVRRFQDSSFQVFLPDGAPARGATVGAYEPPVASEGFGRVTDVDDEGRCTLSCSPTPYLVYARLEGYLDLHATHQGPGPHTLRWPPGALDVRVTDPDGKPLTFVQYLDGDIEPAVPGRLVLKGVALGMHTLIVAARDHYGQVLRVKVGADAPRIVAVQLERRPSAKK